MDESEARRRSTPLPSQQKSPSTLQSLRDTVLIPLAFGVAHGLFARWMFGLKLTSGVFSVMTVSFLFLVSFTLGLLTVALAERRAPQSWSTRLGLPVVATMVALIASVALNWEGSICVVLLSPISIVMSMLGGLVAAWIANARRSKNGRNITIGGLLLVPYVVAPIEMRFSPPDELRVVENEIVVRAPLETVWANVARVPAFREDEHRFAWSHAIGFPRPVEATLSHEGVGGVRHATFERGVLFIETVTVWEVNRKLTFSIHADATTIPPTALDEHVTVGGPFFDVLEGEYELEPLPDGSVRLRLRSRHRVSTHFNAYATLWTDWIMSDVQSYILDIIRRRCEATN